VVLIRLTKLRFGPWLGLREQIWSRLSGSGCPMPCKWYLIRLAKIRFGPNLPGASSSTVAFGHARHSAASYVPVVRCFAANSAGEKMLCRALHRAHCRWGYQSATSVWVPAWQPRNQPCLDAPSYPAPLTAQKPPFDDVLQQSRICFFLVLDSSREKSTILNSEVGR
jgi:hypothetical protein